LRKTLLLVLVFTFTLVPAAAWADGPSGSKEDAGNTVKCGEGTDTPGLGKVYVGPNGIETCSDNNEAPDGRIIVSFDGQYIAADGDKDNGSTSGFIRLDSAGPTCSTPKQQDATAGPGGACGG
jgi:hypothetical protein